MTPMRKKDVDVGDVEVQIKQDPTDDNNYRLHLGGKRVFQWFKEKWQSLKQTVKNSFRIRVIEREPQANHLWLPF